MNAIDKDIRMSESERYLPKQCADFHDRFIGSSAVRLTDERLVDMVYGIDGKADLINGETVNIQFKHRFTDTHIYIPVQYVMDNMINEDACIFRNNPKNFTVKFIPSLNRADYYTFNLKDGPTVIINVRDLHRPFFDIKPLPLKKVVSLATRKRKFTSTISVCMCQKVCSYLLCLRTGCIPRLVKKSSVQ